MSSRRTSRLGPSAAVVAAICVVATALLYAAVDFSDNFDRADSDSLGANWTEAAGDGDIASNAFRLGTGSFGPVLALYTGTPGDGPDQYCMVSLGPNNNYPWCAFRSGASSSAYYAVQIEGSTALIDWYKFDNWADTSGTAINAAQVDIGGDMTGVTMCVTIAGTGDDTVVRIWRGCTGTPSAADNWNGDTTPDASFTDNPGVNAVDSGNYVGIGGQASIADNVTLDNFFGGSFGGGGGGSPTCGKGLLLVGAGC